MTSYLVFPDLALAEARSHQQAVAMGCTGETEYWWSIIAPDLDPQSFNGVTPPADNPTNGQAALAIQDAGDYGPSGLTSAEQVALLTSAQMVAAGWNSLAGT